MCDLFVVASTFDELNIGKVLCNISHPLLKVGYNKKKHIRMPPKRRLTAFLAQNIDFSCPRGQICKK